MSDQKWERNHHDRHDGFPVNLTQPSPGHAHDLKNNSLLYMGEGIPCKVTKISKSKTGKHGHAKMTFTAVSIFNKKAYSGMMPGGEHILIPSPTKLTVQVLDYDEDSQTFNMMDDDCNACAFEATGAALEQEIIDALAEEGDEPENDIWATLVFAGVGKGDKQTLHACISQFEKKPCAPL